MSEKGARRTLSQVIGVQGGIYDLIEVCSDKNGTKLYVPSNLVRDLVIEKRGEIEAVIGKFEVVVEKDRGSKEVHSKASGISLPSTGVVIGDQLSHSFLPVNFIIAKNNEVAVKAVSYVVENLDRGSLVIYGPPGVGKTHLVQATAWRLVSSGIDVAYFLASTLVDFIHLAFKEKATHDLKHQIARAKVLFVDDFQLLRRKSFQGIRDFVFELVDYLLTLGRKIVVVSDVKPTPELWHSIPERLRQRLCLNGDVRIDPPGRDFVRKFVITKLSQRGITVSEEAFEVLDSYVFDSVRDLERLTSYFLVRGYVKVTDVDMEVAASALFGEPFKNSGQLAVKRLYHMVLNEFFDAYQVNEIRAGVNLPRSISSRLKVVREVFWGVLKPMKIARQREVAEALGVTVQALHKWLKEYEKNKDKHPYPVVEQKIREVIQRFCAERKGE